MRNTVRSQFVLAVLATVLVGLVLWGGYVVFAADRSMEVYDLRNETTRLASALFFEKMNALAQVTVAVVGGIWALIVFGSTGQLEGVSKGCFVLANVAFGASLLVYTQGYDFIVERLFHHGAFDIDAPFVVAVKKCQLALFTKGCVDLAALALYVRVRA